ncbi:MAG: hypothetical protein M0003_14335 [Acidithiobacillus sp.]|uniref:hypothetical protein n=3 Tax=Acidithiobacillus TaxID=119977 RepID=UPI0023210D62|nr:hypothetical protein [Acidithiobacillus thiooxidans]MDA8153864.1 hypothetical protein [Acidithiobacillus sp.]
MFNNFLMKIKTLYDKDHAANTLAIIAIAMSLGTLIYFAHQTNIDKADKEYLFWSHMNSAVNTEEKGEEQLYLYLLQSTGKASYILSHVSHDRISCKLVDANPINKSRKITVGRIMENGTRINRKENEEQDSLQEAALENKYLASTLSINGWNSFLQNYKYSESWWSSLSWASMQISFIPQSWAFSCIGKKKEIRVKPSLLNTLSNDTKLSYKDLVLMSQLKTPNILAIRNLEDENMPGNKYKYPKVSTMNNSFPEDVINKASASLIKIAATALYRRSIVQ